MLVIGGMGNRIPDTGAANEREEDWWSHRERTRVGRDGAEAGEVGEVGNVQEGGEVREVRDVREGRKGQEGRAVLPSQEAGPSTPANHAADVRTVNHSRAGR